MDAIVGFVAKLQLAVRDRSGQVGLGKSGWMKIQDAKGQGQKKIKDQIKIQYYTPGPDLMLPNSPTRLDSRSN